MPTRAPTPNPARNQANPNDLFSSAMMNSPFAQPLECLSISKLFGVPQTLVPHLEPAFEDRRGPQANMGQSAASPPHWTQSTPMELQSLPEKRGNLYLFNTIQQMNCA